MENIDDSVRELLKKNRRLSGEYQYTIPSPEIYPFQWLWDSCFHSIILSHFDVESAKKELESVVSCPLPSGLLPHMIFWEKSLLESNWGREMRGDVINEAWQTDGVSSITQPPIIAYAVWRVFEVSKDLSFLKKIFPALVNHFNCLATERTFNSDSLVYIINPDESGEDNSPRFDGPQDLPDVHTANQNLDRRISLINENASCNFNAKSCMSRFFGVADVPFNTLYAQDLIAMTNIAKELGIEDAQRYERESGKVKDEMKKQLKVNDLYLSYDHIHKTHIQTMTWAIFMPLYGELLEKDEAEKLVQSYLCNRDFFKSSYMVPTTSMSESAYDSDNGFWRGPVWIAPNWFIYHGLKKYSFNDIADELKQNTLKLIEQSGFREHYHPKTGVGLGAHDFTWGGLILDMQ